MDARTDRATSTEQTLRALATLPPPQRQVLVLAYIDRLTQPQIADRLGLPLTMVQVTVASGLRRLASAIEGNGVSTMR